MVKKDQLRFADNITLIASRRGDIVELLSRIRNISLTYGLEIKMRKTEVMIIDRGGRPNPTQWLNKRIGS